MLTPERSFWRDFNQAQSSGDADKVVATLSHLADDDHKRVSQQIAWNFAGDGDLQRSQQLAANLDPWQRNNVLRYAISSAA